MNVNSTSNVSVNLNRKQNTNCSYTDHARDQVRAVQSELTLVILRCERGFTL